jgi:hypothetical protein
MDPHIWDDASRKLTRAATILHLIITRQKSFYSAYSKVRAPIVENLFSPGCPETTIRCWGPYRSSMSVWVEKNQRRRRQFRSPITRNWLRASKQKCSAYKTQIISDGFRLHESIRTPEIRFNSKKPLNSIWSDFFVIRACSRAIVKTVWYKLVFGMPNIFA